MKNQRLKSTRSAKSEEAVADQETEALSSEGRKRKLLPAESVLPVDEKKRSKKQRVEPSPEGEPSADVDGKPAEANAAVPVDWAAKKAEKKTKKLERAGQLDEQTKEAAKMELEKKKERESRNEALRQQGKLTKKQRYLAKKAEKKAQAQAQAKDGGKDGPVKLGSARLQAEALAAAGMEKLDPRAVECFLTGLPFSAREQHVIDHFKSVGLCTVKLLRDPSTDRSTGTGFLTFKSAEQALRACALTGSKIQNRWVNVRLCEVRGAGPKTNQEETPSQKPEGCLTAVIKCDKSISEASLWKFFEDCEISGVSCMTDRDTGEFRGMAFLDFEDTAMVDKAVKKSGQTIKGHPIRVRFKQEKKSSPAEGISGAGRSNSAVALHNRAPPVPPPSGKRTKLDSDSEGE